MSTLAYILHVFVYNFAPDSVRRNTLNAIIVALRSSTEEHTTILNLLK